MKRLFVLLIALSFVICFIPGTAQASETTTSIQYFEDGSYLVTNITVDSSRMTTKVASKDHTYYSADSELQWKIVVTGEFLYDGITSTCTYATGTYTIYEPGTWGFVSQHSSYSGNTATHTVTFKSLYLGVTIGTTPFSVSLTCDENGNFS